MSRLASVRHALRLVEPFGAGPASDLADDGDRRGVGWRGRQPGSSCSTAARSGWSARLRPGIEALLTERQDGREPHAAASEALVEEIRRELREVAGIILG